METKDCCRPSNDQPRSAGANRKLEWREERLWRHLGGETGEGGHRVTRDRSFRGGRGPIIMAASQIGESQILYIGDLIKGCAGPRAKKKIH